jgi:hypothetical protein
MINLSSIHYYVIANFIKIKGRLRGGVLGGISGNFPVHQVSSWGDRPGQELVLPGQVMRGEDKFPVLSIS